MSRIPSLLSSLTVVQFSMCMLKTHMILKSVRFLKMRKMKESHKMSFSAKKLNKCSYFM